MRANTFFKKMLSLSAWCLILLSGTATAQIKIEAVVANQLIIIGNISDGEAWNTVSAISGALAGSTTPTTKLETHKLYCRVLGEKTTFGILIFGKQNERFEFALGTDIEKAKESLNAILSFMATSALGTSMAVTDEDSRLIQIDLPLYGNKSRKNINLQVLSAEKEVIIGMVHLTKSNLERAIKLLDKKAEKKIAEVLGTSK